MFCTEGAVSVCYRFTVWAREFALPQTIYAASIGPRILHYLETYFNISFPLPKQDMVALPDFGFSAMENWGLITFR
jgi:aminopeptidase N